MLTDYWDSAIPLTRTITVRGQLDVIGNLQCGRLLQGPQRVQLFVSPTAKPVDVPRPYEAQ